MELVWASRNLSSLKKLVDLNFFCTVVIVLRVTGTVILLLLINCQSFVKIEASQRLTTIF
jgi:hypothetical protein